MSNGYTLNWLTEPAHPTHEQAHCNALERQTQLTKPPGALGRLEEIAVQIASLQGKQSPSVDKVNITVFAADHGIAAEGTSAFPQAVTGEMVKNFATGGAAINVLARQLNAKLEVVNLGCINDPGSLPGVLDRQLAPCSLNTTEQAAMTEQQVADSLNTGREAVQRAQELQCELFIGGDMGIGNTATATALACSLLNQPASVLTGPGTGLDAAGVTHKAAIVQRALDLHHEHCKTPLETLRRLGGFEIAALTGAFISCAQLGIPVLVDGFIAGSAALLATRQLPTVREWLLFGHHSAEPGHRLVLKDLQAMPLLNLGLRLGEGSGAATAVPLLRLACSLHNEMATFAQAGVSDAR